MAVPPTREVHREDTRSNTAMVPWFPDYLLLEGAAALLCVAGLSLAALFVDAPLLALADPQVTPDPSKAPWYFVGLQELLHYYPPVVAGALVPAVTVVLLVAAPFTARRPLWPADGPRLRRASALLLGVGALLALVVLPAQHVPWLVVGPTVALGVALAVPAALRGPVGRRLAKVSLVGWLALWLATQAVVLTVVGALFRGPGWTWTWPWLEGIY